MRAKEYVEAYEAWEKSEPKFSPENPYSAMNRQHPPGHDAWRESRPPMPVWKFEDDKNLTARIFPTGELVIDDNYESFTFSKQDALRLAVWIHEMYTP